MTAAWRTAFVCINEGKHRIDFQAVSHAGFFFSAVEGLGNFVVPAPFSHELVPDVNFSLGWPAAFVEAPPQNLLVSSAFPYSPNYVVILHVQELCAELIEPPSEIALVIGGQFAFVVQPNFVEHSSEIDNAADFCRWAANAQLTHRASNLRVCATPSSFFWFPCVPESAEAYLQTKPLNRQARSLPRRELNRRSI